MSRSQSSITHHTSKYKLPCRSNLSLFYHGRWRHEQMSTAKGGRSTLRIIPRKRSVWNGGQQQGQVGGQGQNLVKVAVIVWLPAAPLYYVGKVGQGSLSSSKRFHAAGHHQVKGHRRRWSFLKAGSLVKTRPKNCLSLPYGILPGFFFSSLIPRLCKKTTHRSPAPSIVNLVKLHKRFGSTKFLRGIFFCHSSTGRTKSK